VAQPPAEAPVTPVSVPGFDYRDAGIGAAITLGAALLAAAGFLALRRSRRTAGLP
jgi:LPXTG-motif cell wall-anchored protein